MVGLLSLPSELIFEIFDHLQPIDKVDSTHNKRRNYKENDPWSYQKSYRTLDALIRTCKLLQPIATRSLYRHYWAPYNKPVHSFIRRLRVDDSIGQAIRHIRILRENPRRQEAARAIGEIHEDLLHVPVLDRLDVPEIFNDPSQLEIALIVAQAPNLESLMMHVRHKRDVTPNDQVPIWFLPIIEAARTWTLNPEAQNMYTRLQVIDIQLQKSYSPNLAYLFCLPRLRCLHLNGLVHQPTHEAEPWPWPVPFAASGLRELKLSFLEAPASMIVNMIHSCKALTSFICEQAGTSPWSNEDFPIQTATQHSAWCTEILYALEQHIASLKLLHIEPRDRFVRDDEHYCCAPVDSFRKFRALDTLVTPFMLLMGRLASAATVDGIKNCYPRMSDVLPPNLERLSLSLCSWTAINAVNDTIVNAMPMDSEQATYSVLPLQHVHIVYTHRDWDDDLRLNFWSIKSDFLKRNVEFRYEFCEDIHFGDYYVDPDRPFKVTAPKLARHGTAGVEMAQHFDEFSDEMMAKVMEILGLEEDWLSTDEGRRVMFREEESSTHNGIA